MHLRYATAERFMSNSMNRFLFALAVVLTVSQAQAFTLLGPLGPWQTARLGYLTDSAIIGGPMNLGEEYRWNVPVVYYGYTPEFLNYFGQHGVDEVEKAVKFLNDLPPASQLNLDDYPLDSQRINHRARALQLVDLKSEALSMMVQAMGICDPTRYVFTLRNRWNPPMITNYYVIKRNFDPVTWQHSSYINGELWTYTTILDNATGVPDSLVINNPVDPLALFGVIRAPVTSGFSIGNSLLLYGGYWTGLTRDDAGGLKYIYRGNNYNVENAATNAIAGSFGVSGGGGGKESPWLVPTPPPTNAVPGTVVSNNFVNIALRAGINRVTFVRANYNSLFGIFEPFTNSWTDTYVTNRQVFNQRLSRPQLIPDILFDASDLQGPDDNGGALPVWAVGFQPWVNNQGINGIDNASEPLRGDLGPGVIDPAVAANLPALLFTFNSVGPIFFNQADFFVSEVNSLHFFLWGSFDGSTNEPVVYPISTSIQQVEAQVLGGR